MEKMAFTVAEAAEAIGVSERMMYNIVHIAGFPKKIVGKRIIIPVKALERWLDDGTDVPLADFAQ